MRLLVEGAGYRSAAQAFVDGNQAAARLGLDLSGELAAYAGMAGDDATATEFAATYDEAAAAAVEVAAELVDGFASLARLAEGSLRNHVAAERASVLAGLPAGVDEPLTLAERCTVVHLATPASALGGDSSALPGWANAVLDLLEGVFWPDADTDRLRAAAATWRAGAGAVRALVGPCESALAELAVEASPEIPLAVATTEDLRGHIDRLADQLTGLATACEDHAAHVDATRDEMLAVLEQLAWELGLGALASGALTLITGGAAAGAAGAAGTARLAAASARLRGVLDSLGALSRGTAATLRPVGATMRETRVYLARISAARTERGSANLGSYFIRGRRKDGWLRAHEKPPGHTIREHVGRSDRDLLERLARRRRIPYSSSFKSERDAERLISSLLDSQRSEIRSWLRHGEGNKRLDEVLESVTGRTAFRDGPVKDVFGIRVVLIRDSSMPEGFRILTSFPQP